MKQILKAASSTETTAPKFEEVDLDEMAKSGYEAAYSKLIYANKPEYDPLLGKIIDHLEKKTRLPVILLDYFGLTGIGDVIPYFARNLSTLSQRYPGKLAGIISSNLTVEEQQLLQGYLSAAGVQM